MNAGLALREWQKKALEAWRTGGCRGLVEVVTGGGKTVFALACIRDLKADTVLVVVPTTALLEQWWAEVAAFFELSLDEVNIVTGNRSLVTGTINIAVLNTAAKFAQRGVKQPCFLIVDECHKAASAQFRVVFDIPTLATLGLSATPERPYDDGLTEVLVPALGSIVYRYTYREALRDGVIVPFEVRNIVFDLEDDRMAEYERLTRAITRTAGRLGIESDEAVALLLRRARVVNLSLRRIEIALRLVKVHRNQRVLIFHEDVEACNIIFSILSDAGFRAGVYHSRLRPRERAEMLARFRKGGLDVLVTCRALDEGFNVPETEVGIIAASTATRRQRIQRLGRILRPANGKNRAVVYTLAATGPEVGRLREEEENLSEIATITWARA